MKQGLLFAYYGDDFTGSTDALEFLNRAGVKTMLFMEVPTKEYLAQFPTLAAIGIAGKTRSMPPVPMRAELKKDFEKLNQLGIQQLHYKVCSTFDSSPHTGNAGVAIEEGLSIFNPTFVPLLLTAPALGRYTLFGNLFAKLGIGSDGEIYRLDRHPSISNHPVTPMQEADLRLHLKKQTDLSIGLVNILDIKEGKDQIKAQIDHCIQQKNDIILFDALDTQDLESITTVLADYLRTETIFSIGSSGIEMAWGAYWNRQAVTIPTTNWPKLETTKATLVLSGSCSPVTSEQITFSIKNGYKDLSIPSQVFSSIKKQEEIIEDLASKAIGYLRNGFPVVIHTNIGQEDPRNKQTHEILLFQGIKEEQMSFTTAATYGHVLSKICLKVAEAVSLKRLVVAGGDTSSYVARNLKIKAVEMLTTFTAGAPICKAHSSFKTIDGLEINFKGGQVGNKNYFINILKASN